ncbi:MAG: T9SS type A sorting domain-containing protein [Candidatus Eisenbacteria bacterium]|uniref:T9SS type A sorting domain-containing protein n=1 Tax=Eiseniibacteriota bacterium TaxID=2212470 RepID=A0A849SM26_UNCEI|nr:T9SS type A sorting domain-containing protein [Candidatus Eisenbacteria bacterium]
MHGSKFAAQIAASPRLLGVFATAMALVVGSRTTHAQCTSASWFVPGPAVTVGANPAGIVLGDFNNDGIRDFAMTISGWFSGVPSASNVRIYLGQGSGGVGNGSFSPAQSILPGTNPFGIASGDFFEDGIADLAVANYGSGQVSLIRGLGASGVGNGTFASSVQIPLPGGPHELVARDFNHDGILDLAVTLNASNKLAILLGRGGSGVGDGTFDPAVLYTALDRPNGIAAGDFDEDGHTDLAVCGYYSGKVEIFRGLGDGSFTNVLHLPAGPEPIWVTTGDTNMDGITDLLVASTANGGIWLLRGLGVGGVGNGTFAAATFLAPGNAVSVQVADVDQDGFPDVVGVVSNHLTVNYVTSLRGHGDGTFDPERMLNFEFAPARAEIGDFDGGSMLDVITPMYTSNNFFVLHGECLSDPRAPQLAGLGDVPNDQGGKVFLTWGRSSLDVTSGAVNSYVVWRRVPEFAAEAAMRAGEKGERPQIRVERVETANGTQLVYWEALATLPAQRLAGYGYTAATTQDSLPGSNPYSAFFVTARTASVDVFYDSPVDSTYSVDNLSPSAPGALAANDVGAAVRLSWAASNAPDVHEYRVYRGDTPLFEADAAALVGFTQQLQFDDGGGSAGDWYKVRAVDVHQNLGAVATAAASGPTSVVASGTVVSTGPGEVEVLWQLSGEVFGALAERRTSNKAWQTLGEVTILSGRAQWIDRSPPAGALATYRLVDRTNAALMGSEIEVRVPGWQLELAGARPNPTTASTLEVHFTLATDRPARLEVFDLSGRRMASHDVGAMGAGPHQVRVSGTRSWPAGIYTLRLSTEGSKLLRRVVLVP